MATFTELYDACVLYPAPLRDLLLGLALTDLFRAKWSSRIHDEWIWAVLEDRPDLTAVQLRRTSDLMEERARDGSTVVVEEQNGTDRKPIRVSSRHSLIRHRMAVARMRARSPFVTPHGGAGAIVHDSSARVVGVEPGAPWLRAGCGSAASDSPSHAV